MVRKGLIVAILFGSVIMIVYHYLSRPKPLRPIVVTWQEVGEVWGFVDLDADGNDDLIVRDQNGQFWWVRFRLLTPIRQKIPAPKRVGFYFSPRGQMLALWHPKTRQALLITRQGEEWIAKDLGKLKEYVVEVVDADHDGQVNDAVVWHGQTRTILSRMKGGTIVERPNLPDFQADLDGDGEEDEVYVVHQPAADIPETRIRCSSGREASLDLPSPAFIGSTVADIDGDKVAEIVCVDVWDDGFSYRFHCWRYENGRWLKSSSSKFGGMRCYVVDSDDSLGFIAEGKMSLFRDEKGAYMLAVTVEGQQGKVWEVRWREGKWTKRLMGEVPEHNTREVVFARKRRDWIVIGSASPPDWQEWLWKEIGQYLQRFLPFLQEPQLRFFVYGWDGQQNWTLLGRWSRKRFGSFQLADMDGDGERELTIAFPKRVLVAKFEDGRWRTGWVKLSFVGYAPIGVFGYALTGIEGIFCGFRYGRREWVLYQEAGNHRCVAIALERQQ